MSADSKTVFDAALSLPPNDRAELAERLMLSLDAEYYMELQRAWNEENDRRVAAIDNGTATLLTHEQVMERLRERRKA